MISKSKFSEEIKLIWNYETEEKTIKVARFQDMNFQQESEYQKSETIKVRICNEDLTGVVFGRGLSMEFENEKYNYYNHKSFRGNKIIEFKKYQ